MKSIHLENFKCFLHLDMCFAPGVNLLVGDNASGKTSLLLALRSALSSFFLGYSDENTRFLGLSKDDFTQRENESSILNDLPIKVGFDVQDTLQEDACGYIMLKSKKSRTAYAGASSYKALAHDIFRRLFDVNTNTQQEALPLFASFSTEDIHAARKLDRGRFKEYKHKPSFGYYECLQGDGLFSYWLDRMLVLAEKDAHHIEIECVNNAIQKALGPDGCNIIESMVVRPRKGEVFYRFVDGREVESNDLSDGYKRLVNIVTDLAFRCALLNGGIYHLQACDLTKGTVLIDEIDLHLHPTLQSSAIAALRRSFPCLQFIISTHAPMVMSSVVSNDENYVYKMCYSTHSGYSHCLIQPYGMDASTIIATELGITPRDQKVQDSLDKLFQYIDNDQFDVAKKQLSELRSQFRNELPELVKAQTMIDLMEESFNA